MGFILVRLLLVIILLAILIRLLKKLLGRPKNRSASSGGEGNRQIEEMRKDPVCGVFVPVSQALSFRHRQETIYFCSEECRKKFLKKIDPS